MLRVEKILFALMGLVLILGGVWVFQGWQSWRELGTLGTPDGQLLNYSQAKQAENPTNPCLPPAGYTEATWREHMSHHPDQYKQCLGG